MHVEGPQIYQMNRHIGQILGYPWELGLEPFLALYDHFEI